MFHGKFRGFQKSIQPDNACRFDYFGHIQSHLLLQSFREKFELTSGMTLEMSRIIRAINGIE